MIKSLQLYREYKDRVKDKGYNFIEWVDIKYPELKIKSFQDRFIKDWLNGPSNIHSNNTFVLWLCKNYYIVDVNND